MRSLTLTVIFCAIITISSEHLQQLTTYYFPNYYCSPSICPNGGPHVACNAPNPFGASCYGKNPQLIPMTDVMRAQILDQHNRMRSLLASGQLPGYSPAVKMPTLQWDLELQYLAEANARSCEYGHDKCRNTNWSNPQIGHFTQIISDRTVKIGCGMVTYQTYNGELWTHDYFVCNYSFTNIINQPSYIKGHAGSQCSTGVSSAYPGLCN
ncbi:hypothetical protein pipiens_016397 [Culex pipiens pipiens]|uniref:SCP domain-containing protein n=1 Tax=Culex pipiens pipiens TaxID=38569 RepID=A0ABD1CMR6_CULPP